MSYSPEEARHQLEERISLKSLDDLSQWLVDEGNSDVQAVSTSETIKSFCLDHLLPVLGPIPEIGITAQRAEVREGQHIWLLPVWPTKVDISSPEQSRQVNDLRRDFTERMIPLLPNPSSIHLDIVSPNWPESETFENLLKEDCQERGLECFGIIRTVEKEDEAAAPHSETKVVFIDVKIDPESLPEDPGPCSLCGGELEKAMLDYGLVDPTTDKTAEDDEQKGENQN